MGKFVIKTVKTGVRFNLLANNGQVIGTSEIYKADASCLNGIDSVRRSSIPNSRFMWTKRGNTVSA